MGDLEVSIKKKELLKTTNNLFAKFGSDRDQEIAKRNLEKLEKMEGD